MKSNINGTIMMIIGFLLVLAKAADYLFYSGDNISAALAILGLVFLGVGASLLKQKKAEKTKKAKKKSTK